MGSVNESLNKTVGGAINGIVIGLLADQSIGLEGKG